MKWKDFNFPDKTIILGGGFHDVSPWLAKASSRAITSWQWRSRKCWSCTSQSKFFLYFYDFKQRGAFLHHGSFAASPDDRVCDGSEKGWNSKPLKWGTDWISEQGSFRDETQVKWCHDSDGSPAWGWKGDSMEPKLIKKDFSYWY